MHLARDTARDRSLDGPRAANANPGPVESSLPRSSFCPAATQVLTSISPLSRPTRRSRRRPPQVERRWAALDSPVEVAQGAPRDPLRVEPLGLGRAVLEGFSGATTRSISG